jgi:CHASE2 domain-containing sensor protein/tRNA A-37 threonylcarbamoyl transferase component Bud32
MLELLLKQRYQLISELGSGGFGQTYLAADLEHDRLRCVVKQFKPAKTEEHFLAIARRLFDTEVKMLERLGQHPQIPSFLDFFEEAGEFYLVQEFIEGRPLSDELTFTHRLNETAAIALLRDVLGILDFVHSQQVIHRDIKPNNLIRRSADNRIVLIDFGAVKEIGTQLLSETDQKFTVAIGTQGYTPSEQLAGRPRYCSDLYALGMTAIQAITGLQPTQFPANPDTGELIWQNQAPIGLGLQHILERMVCYHFNQRYQAAQEVLQALDHLAASPQDSTVLPSSLVMPLSLLHYSVADGTVVDSPVQSQRQQANRRSLRQGLQIIALTTVAVTGFIAGLQKVGWLQAPELVAYDRLTQLRPATGLDSRLLIVEITEPNLQTLQRSTPSDQDVAQVIRKLQQYQPRAIGLDLHRDLPQEPGHAELMQQLQASNVVTIMKLGSGTQTFDIPPPASVPPERLGFNDFPIDPDGVIRRSLLYGSINKQNFMAFSLRLALQYLQPYNIQPRESPDQAGVMQLDQTVFPPLAAQWGGYSQLDAAGYQIMLDYRAVPKPTQSVSFMDVLKQPIDPALVKDRIVLIGTTAASGKDLFYTPFSSGQQAESLMPGVVVHAQMVSQILSAVLDQRPLIWTIPNWVQLIWIGGWACTAATLAWFIRHPLLLIGSTVGVLILLGGTVFLVFLQAGWLPGVAPAIALVLAGATVVSWRSYQVD